MVNVNRQDVEPRFRRRRIKRVNLSQLTRISFLPSVFTTLNLFFGFTALLHILKGNFLVATFWITASVIMDGFDGTIARLTKTESNFGVQLDSLSDAVAFGLVPAVLIYYWGFANAHSQVGKLVAFSFLAAGVIRLARFNVFKEAKAVPSSIFIGFPIPGGALAISSVVLLFNSTPPRTDWEFALYSLFCLAISFLMISNVKYRTAKKILNKQSLAPLMLLALVVASMVLYPGVAIPILTSIYLLSPIGFALYFRLKRKPEAAAATTPVPPPRT